jgi:sodium-coupled neutral amino acid transporter 11
MSPYTTLLCSRVIALLYYVSKDMANLSFTSAISVTADLILVIFVFWFAPVSESIQAEGGLGQVLRQDAIQPTLFIGLGVLSTAMACQHSAFIVSGSLQSLTRARWAVVTGSSLGIATILCAALGSAGYLGFLDDTQGDVLNNFDAGSPAANGARALLAITMLFTYPMEAFVVRHVISSIFFAGDLEADQDMSPPLLCGMDMNTGLCNRRRSLTFAIYLCTLVPALIFDDLGPILSITGALGGSCIAYILPGLVFLGVNGEHFTSHCHTLLQDRAAASGKTSTVNVNVNGIVNTKGPSSSTTDADGHIELPVAGDATQRAGDVDTTTGRTGTLELPVEGQQVQMAVFKESKPL